MGIFLKDRAGFTFSISFEKFSCPQTFAGQPAPYHTIGAVVF